MQFRCASRCSRTAGASRRASGGRVDPKAKGLLRALVSTLVLVTICFRAVVLQRAACQRLYLINLSNITHLVPKRICNSLQKCSVTSIFLKDMQDSK